MNKQTREILGTFILLLLIALFIGIWTEYAHPWIDEQINSGVGHEGNIIDFGISIFSRL